MQHEMQHEISEDDTRPGQVHRGECIQYIPYVFY